MPGQQHLTEALLRQIEFSNGELQRQTNRNPVLSSFVGDVGACPTYGGHACQLEEDEAKLVVNKSASNTLALS